MRTRNFDKPKNFKKSFADLFRYIKKYMTVIIIALILAIAGTVLSLIGPNKVGDLSNLIAEGMFLPTGIDFSAVNQIAYTLIVIYLLSVIFTYVQAFIMTTVTQRVSKKLRGDICSKINRLPLKYLDSHSHGDILSRVTNDVDTIGQSLNNSVTSLVTSLSMLIGCIIMMVITNWIMALSAIGATIIGFVLMGVIMSKSQKYFKAQQETLGELNGKIEESYTGHAIVKAFNGKNDEKESFEKTNSALYTNAWKSQFFSGIMQPLMAFVGNFSFVVVCVVGAVLCSKGMIDFGVIVSFMIYIRLFTSPLGQLAQVATTLQSTSAASERVFEFLGENELEDESDKQTVLTDVKGKVEFKNVTFGYDKGKTIIHDFSVKIKPGDKIAIVGPTGAGKTTLVNLLMRFYEVDSGEILIDDVPISKLKRENIHKLFGMVLQDTWLFEGTIRENLKYGKPDADDREIEHACEIAGVDHFIRTLPEGYETVLMDSTSISVGQKQLLTIARAMVENAPMLILDEATSSVDTRTEKLIQKAMDNLTKGRTTFVIAHRLSTIKNANLILVMKDGNIIEKGNHKSLMKQGGFYKELYESQFSSKYSEIVED
ncbi:MAG: ABC transporter ATP-binding protein [Christensenellales bacterium]